jgi:hypothetical protein
MSAFPPHWWRVITLCALLSGCSVNGSYPGVVDPNPAKLRFVANVNDATLTLFDAGHCQGYTTGLLNNLFVRDSSRRVGMSFPPPADARGYLEIKLKPEQPTFLMVCGTPAFNLTPAPGAEYELKVDSVKSRCVASLQQVERVDGKILRTSLPLESKGLAACVGVSPIFPVVPLPDTPERVAMIDRIIDASITPDMNVDSAEVTRLRRPPDKLEAQISARKASLWFTFPEEYWAQYRRNFRAFEHEMSQVNEQALARYRQELGRLLRQYDDQTLDTWRGPVAEKLNREMREFYLSTDTQLAHQAFLRLIPPMAELDDQYGVCLRSMSCWKWNLH